MINSSPMYGSSQPVIGYGLQKLGRPSALFSAEKVWTSSAAAGPAQIEQSRRFWGVPKFDLVQVHNLLAWKAHLQTLFEMKAAGAVRYVGITTSEGRRHDLLEQIMRSEPIDFVQFSYNVVDREAEARLLPLASERGIAVIVNRPFRQGALTRPAQALSRCPNGRPRLGVSSWAQLMLKFILSHPAVTVAIPATTRVDHVRENLSGRRRPDAGPGHAAAHRGPREGALMSEWWTYRPANFLLFSPRVYWRMFELHNAALWPLQVLTLAAGLIIILLIARRPGSWARWLALILAILWIFVGWSFLWNRYATINWAAAYVAPAFSVEGVLLLVWVSCSTASLSTGGGLPVGSDISSLLSHSPDSRCWRRCRDAAGPRPRFLASRRIRRRSRRSAFCSSPAAGYCHCCCRSPFSGAS